MRIDGFEAPIDLVASRTSSDDEIVVDFDGTSGVSTFGINCPLCYTEAYTTFGVRCLVGPGLPNNTGSLEPTQVKAPLGTIVNPPPPCAVVPRSTIGHMLPDVVFGGRDPALPNHVPAEGPSHLRTAKPRADPGQAARA